MLRSFKVREGDLEELVLFHVQVDVEQRLLLLSFNFLSILRFELGLIRIFGFAIDVSFQRLGGSTGNALPASPEEVLLLAHGGLSSRHQDRPLARDGRVLLLLVFIAGELLGCLLVLQHLLVLILCLLLDELADPPDFQFEDVLLLLRELA